MAACSSQGVPQPLSSVATVPGAEPSSQPPIPEQEQRVRRKRPRLPKIDIDALIAQHLANMKNAKKLEAEAKKLMRNEKRKKQRLMKKASNLTPDDLERIAVLKRCGLWDPANGVTIVPATEDNAAAAPQQPQQALEDAAAPAAGSQTPIAPASDAAAVRESDTED